jgi:lantibiotic modifying enzyme
VATRDYRRTDVKGSWWESNHSELEHSNEGINAGAAGVIVGMASIDHASGRRLFDTDIAGGADWLASRRASSNAHGMYTGNAGVALALAVAGRRLGRTDWIDAARARLDAAISLADDYDLFSGLAGVLFCGVAMASILDEEWPLRLVASCGSALMRDVEELEGVLVWPSIGSEEFFTGAAHGSAGIAMALAAWGMREGSSEAYEMAVDTFAALYQFARAGNQSTFVRALGSEPLAAPPLQWCHGVAGYLWSILVGLGTEPRLSAEIDWAIENLAGINAVGSSVYCHGLAGELELWRLVGGSVSRFGTLALRRSMRTASLLRLQVERRNGHTVWPSEDPETVTPDLWVGFLGPATALSLYASRSTESILSPAWLAACARDGHAS